VPLLQKAPWLVAHLLTNPVAEFIAPNIYIRMFCWTHFSYCRGKWRPRRAQSRPVVDMYWQMCITKFWQRMLIHQWTLNQWHAYHTATVYHHYHCCCSLLLSFISYIKWDNKYQSDDSKLMASRESLQFNYLRHGAVRMFSTYHQASYFENLSFQKFPTIQLIIWNCRNCMCNKLYANASANQLVYYHVKL